MIEKLISHESVFVMVTAETSQAMVLSALEHEPDAYLTKPFNRSGLAQRLERLEQRKNLLKPILQALDRGKPLEVLNGLYRAVQAGHPLFAAVPALSRRCVARLESE